MSSRIGKRRTAHLGRTEVLRPWRRQMTNSRSIPRRLANRPCCSIHLNSFASWIRAFGRRPFWNGCYSQLPQKNNNLWKCSHSYQMILVLDSDSSFSSFTLLMPCSISDRCAWNTFSWTFKIQALPSSGVRLTFSYPLSIMFFVQVVMSSQFSIFFLSSGVIFRSCQNAGISSRTAVVLKSTSNYRVQFYEALFLYLTV